MTISFDTLLEDFWDALGGGAALTGNVALSGPRHALPSAYDVTGLSVASIAVAKLAVAELHALRRGDATPRVQLDSQCAAVAFRGERHVQPRGWSLPPAWDPVAGNYRARDGFVRLHTNYAHHRRAAMHVLGVAEEREAVERAVAGWESGQLEAAIVEAGGCAAAMRSPAQWRAHPQGVALAAAPLVQRGVAQADAGRPRWATHPGGAAGPLAGIRVLDLTRVIAGPVGTRLLAAYGADVLRIDPPGFEEVGALLTETTLGKSRAWLDLHATEGRARFEQLLREADVLVHGYRSGALAALGYDHGRLRADYPQLVVTQHNAYGFNGPWAQRRGFDSLVQMSCGIAARGQAVYGADGPHPLPAQALDHATGYLIAAATCRALSEYLERGRLTHSRLSLAATAEALMGLGEVGDPKAPVPSAEVVARYLEEADSNFGPLQRVRVPACIEGVRPAFARPAGPLGSDAATF
jgi:hypothetical protein